MSVRAKLGLGILMVLILSSIAYAANDPGHDILYVELIGDVMTGTLIMSGANITNVSYLGVGTSSPGYILDVNRPGIESDASIARFTSNRNGTAGGSFVLRHLSGNAADSDSLGNLFFAGYDNETEETTYASIYTYSDDITNGTEDGGIEFKTLVAGTSTTVMRILSGNVGIGTDSPVGKLNVETSSGDSVVRIDSPSSSDAILALRYNKGAGNNDQYFLKYDSTNSGFALRTSDSDGAGTDADVMTIADGGINVIFKGKVGINLTSPQALLDVNGTAIIRSTLNMTGQRIIGLGTPTVGTDATTKTYVDAQVAGSGVSGWNDTGTVVGLITSTDDVNATTLYINNTALRVGIGTMSPDAILHVMNNSAASTSGSQIARFSADYAGGQAGKGGYISFADTSSPTVEVGRIRSYTDGTNVIGFDFSTYNSGLNEGVFHIKGDGNVGVGTLTPISRLDVYGNVSLNRTLYVTENGSVGIGTAAPGELLDVRGDAIFGAGNNVGSTNQDLEVTSSTGAVLSVSKNNDVTGEALLGKVAFVEHDASAGTQNSILVSIQGYADAAISGDASRDGHLRFYTTTNAAESEQMRITSAGYVGIGTATPISKLDVYGNVSLNRTLYVTENGSVGIGTASPTSKLHVVGGANISTNLSVGGTLAVGTYARNWTQFGNGTKSEADTNNFNDVYITGDLEVNGVIHGTIGAENVQDIWVNESGDTMTGNLVMSGNNITNVSYLGVGTTAPWHELSVLASSGDGNIGVRSEDYNTSDKGTELVLSAINNSASYTSISSFKTGGAAYGNLILLPSGGNVGIGLTSPEALLDVNGTVIIRSTLNMTGQKIIGLGTPVNDTDATTKAYVDTQIIGAGYAGSGWNDTGTVVKLITSTDDVNATTLYVNNTAGRVGIGTMSPTYPLQVEGTTDSTAYTTLALRAPSSGDGTFLQFSDGVTYNYAFGTEPTTGDFAWYSGRYNGVAGTQRMILTQSGYVGIGTDSPISALDVYGNVSLNRTLYVTESGSVGIGTANPGERLDVRGGDISIRDAAGTGGFVYGYDENHGIYMREGNSDKINYYEYGGNLSEGKGHLFYTGGVKASQSLRLQIANDGTYIEGNLGVNVTTPNATLEIGDATRDHIDGKNDILVAGDVEIDGDIWVDGVIHGTIGAENVQDIWVNESGDTMTGNLVMSGNNITNVSYLGVGTNSPDGYLHIYTEDTEDTIQIQRAANVDNGMIKFKTGATQDWIIGERNDGTSDFRIYSYGTSNDVFSILRSNGNVGIGTTTPSEKLHVEAGSIFINGESRGIIVDAGGNKRVGLMKYGGREAGIWRNPNQDFEIGRVTGTIISPTAYTTDIYVAGDGDVGIGTVSPDAKLDINSGWIRIDNGYGIAFGSAGAPSDYLKLQDTGSGNTLELVQDSTKYFVVEGVSGNVGIGDSSPTKRLWVAGGGAEFSSSLSINENATTNQYGNRALSASLATSTSGWSTWTGGSGCGVATDSTYSFEGQTTTIKATKGTAQCWVDPNPSPAVAINTQYSTTFIMRNSAGTQPSGITFRYDNEGCSPSWEAYGNGWYRGTCIHTTDGTTSNQWDGFSIDSGDYIWVARAQIEQKSVPTAFTARVRTAPSVSLSVPLEVNTNSNSYFYGGNVGIGTTSPEQKLDVVGGVEVGSSSSAYINLEDTGGVGRYAIARSSGTANALILGDGGTFSKVGVGYAIGDAIPQMFSVDGAGYFAGNVGIGTASPGATLDVKGSADGKIRIYGTAGADDAILEFLNQGAASTEGFRILYDNDVGDTYLDNIWDGGVDTNPAIRFRTKTAGTAVNVMTITHGGNVGIGTTSPSGLFHVYENSASEKNWYFENAGAGIGQLNIKGGSGAYFTIGASSSAAFTQTTKPYNFQQYYNSTWNSVMYIDNGNVGIGTITPNATLDVNGTAVIRSTLNMTGQKIIGLGTPTVGTDATTKAYVDGQIGGGGYIQSGWNDTGTKVGLITSTDDVNATTLYINNTAGRVGIGTMSPSELLELSGGNLQLDSTSDTGIKGASSDNIITNNPSFGGSTGNWGIKTGGGVTLWIDDNAASPGEEFEVKAGTGQTSLFKIEGSGNVGIGTTTSLSRKLTVYGGIDLYGETVGSSDVGLILYHPQEGGVDATRWAMRADRTNDASYPYLTNREPAGKVVIKTGTAAGGAENTHFTIEGGDGTVNTYFENTNVGIGTTSPTSKLHVVGGANISTNLSVGGTLAVGTYARNWTQFGTGTKSEADTNDSNDVYITGDLEVDGTIHGTIGAENVQDIWVNVTGDTMTGDLLLSNNASLNVTGNISTDGTLAVSGVQQEYSVFGPGTKDEADISTSEDVYITGDLEVDGTIYGSLGNIGDIWVNETGDTMTGNLIMGGNNITNVSYLGVGTNNPAGPLEIVYGSLDRLHFEVGKSGGSAAQVAMIADSGYTTSTPDVLIQDADSDNTRAALQIQGNVGATEVAFFSSGGNVGFGDTTPDEKLDVEGEIQAGTGTYRTTITGGGGGSYIYMGTEASDSSLATVGAYGSLFNIDSSNGPISFKLSGSEKARIDSTGLGVGTTSPGYKLDVRGTGYYSGDLTLAGATKYNNFNYVRSGTAGWFKLGTLTLAQQGNNAWIRMYAGNGYNAANSQNAYVDLFIRTSNGGSVDGNGFCASAFASRFGQDADFISQIKLVSNAAGCSATAYDIYAYTGTYIGNGWYSVETSIGSWSHSATTASDPGVGSSTVYVTPFEHRIGNTLHVTGSSVGIGDSSPDYKFEVDGTSDFGDTTTFGDGAQGTITWGSGPSRFVLTAGSGNELYLGAGGTSGQIVVQTDGDVGIGTVSPDSKFQVNDNSFPQARINNDNVIAANGETGIRFRSRGTSGDAHADIGWTGTGAETGNLVFRVPYTTERMRITSAGNVGIGTASPGQELHIAGSWPQMIVAQDDGTEDASIQFDAGGANNRWNVGPGAGAAEGEEFGFAVYNDAGGHVRTNVWIEETGQVGIGIDDPVGTLTIKAHTNGWDGGITLISQDGLQTFKLHPENSAGYGLMISGETYFANKAAFIGNVGIGIGTASPIAKLEAGYTSYGAGNYPLLIRNGRTYSHVTYDTAVIAQNDVTTLRLVETTGGVNQELGISVGDSEGVITSTEELDFYVSSTPGANIYSGAGGERALRMQTDGDIEMMGGNVGIGTASPSTKLHVVGGDGTATSIKTDGYVEDVSGVVHGNYISSHSWTISTGSVGEFSQNGATSENSREWGIGPQGNRAILWKAVPDAVSGADGGWNAAYFSIDHTKMYRFSVWIKKTGSNDGSTYFGTNGETATVTSLGGTPNSNPYFFAGDLSSLDKWYLLVGYVHGSGDTSTTNYGKIYDGETGKAVTGLTDFKFQTSTTGARHRSYLYYDVTTTDRQYWWDPRVEEVNGKEPTIEALLGMPRSNTNGMYWGSGAAIGIGTTAPSNELEVNGDIELTNLYDNDASNFFDGSCSVSETLNTISSTGAISCQAISLSASSVEDVWINESGDTTGALTSDLNIDANTFVISYDDNRVGIGTASPGGLLDISGDNKKFVVTSNDYELFNFGARGSGGTALDMAYMQMKKEGVITNVLDTNGVSYIMGGNVGIGTTNPDSLLEVEGANAIGHFDSTSALSETRYSRSGTVYGRVAHRSSASSQYATDGFNVISHDELGLVSFDAAGYISFHVGTENPVTEDMRLTVDGELGIGTTVPNSKLDVRGSLNVTQSSGSLIVDSSGNVLIGI